MGPVRVQDGARAHAWAANSVLPSRIVCSATARVRKALLATRDTSVAREFGVLMLQGPPYSTEQRTLMGLLLPSADLTRLHHGMSVHDIMVQKFGDDYMTILIPNCPQRAQPNDRPWWR